MHFLPFESLMQARMHISLTIDHTQKNNRYTSRFFLILLYAMPSQRVLIRMIYQKESRILVWVFIRIKFSPVPR